MPSSAKPKSYPASFGVNDKDGRDTVLNEAESDKPVDSMDSTTAEGSSGRGSGEGHDTSGTTGASGESLAPPSKSQGDTPPNPFQAKGDISSAWYRRLDLFEASDYNQQQEDTEQRDGNKGPYEFASAESSSKQQVLASAIDDDVAALPDHQEEEPSDLPAQLDDKDFMQRKKENLSESISRRKSVTNNKNRESTAATQHKDADNASQDNDYEGAVLAEDSISFPSDRPERPEGKAVYSNALGEQDVQDTYPITALPVEEIHQSEIKHLDDADKNWLRYRNQTEVYSLRLCEQLRLILEPQLASRLQGDYRSGKRINMRKVIGYVASGFRRDKIWLRRTKPSKRDYQVMLLVDDSRSMKEAGSLTMAAVATIANALSKVEVGDVCVASFADKVRILHSFGNAAKLSNAFDLLNFRY